MAKDAGAICSAAIPAGTLAGTGIQVQVTDPLGGIGYVNLFRQNGLLLQNAGINYKL